MAYNKYNTCGLDKRLWWGRDCEGWVEDKFIPILSELKESDIEQIENWLDIDKDCACEQFWAIINDYSEDWEYADNNRPEDKTPLWETKNHQDHFIERRTNEATLIQTSRTAGNF